MRDVTGVERSCEALIEEAEAAPIEGWDFGWLEGRATEERPSWGYSGLLAERARDASSLLDLQTGGGELLGGLPWLPPLTVATEGWAPNVSRAAQRLHPRGAWVVFAHEDRPTLPFGSGTFDLVVSRHPVLTWWDEVARVLRPGGRYLSQQIGPHTMREVTEFFMVPQPATIAQEAGAGPGKGDDRRAPSRGRQVRATSSHLRRRGCGRLLPATGRLDGARFHGGEVPGPTHRHASGDHGQGTLRRPCHALSDRSGEARLNPTTLGTTGLAVTRIGFGLAALGRPAYITLGRNVDLGSDRDRATMEQRCHDMLDAAYAAGIRYVDTARSYGRAEEFLASWLRPRAIAPDAITVGSKWGYRYTGDWNMAATVHETKDHSLAMFRDQLPQTSALLGPHLDLYQVHSATLESGVLDDHDVLHALAELGDSGVAVGLTVSGPRQADVVRHALELGVDGVNPFSTVQATWNVLEPSVGPALGEARARGWGVLVKEALANGRLTARGDDGAGHALQAVAARHGCIDRPGRHGRRARPALGRRGALRRGDTLPTRVEPRRTRAQPHRGGLGPPRIGRRECDRLLGPAQCSPLELTSKPRQATTASDRRWAAAGVQVLMRRLSSSSRRPMASGVIPNRQAMARTSLDRIVMSCPLKSWRWTWIMLTNRRMRSRSGPLTSRNRVEVDGHRVAVLPRLRSRDARVAAHPGIPVTRRLSTSTTGWHRSRAATAGRH